MDTPVETDQPRFVHDCEVSLVPCVGKCHYLGTQVASSGDVVDLYIHVRDQTVGNTELLARFGDEGVDYLCASLSTIFYTQRGVVDAGLEGDGVRMAYDAAEAAGYDLRTLSRYFSDTEDPDQAYLDAMSEGGNPYTDAAGMVDEGADSYEV
jgi:hypothetical protein